MKYKTALFALILPTIVGLTLLTQSASAQFVQMQMNQTDLGAKVDIKYLNALTGSTTTDAGQFAGQLQYAFDNGPGFTMPTSPFDTYCVDLDHFVSVGNKYLVLPTSTSAGLNNGSKIAYLYNTYASGITDGDHAAALQVAIWELLKDNDANLDMGNFVLTSGGNVRTYAQQYLTNVGSSTAGWGDAGLGGSLASHWQSVLVPGYSPPGRNIPGVSPVPEPGVVSLLFSIPTAGFLLLRRRRKARR